MACRPEKLPIPPQIFVLDNVVANAPRAVSSYYHFTMYRSNIDSDPYLPALIADMRGHGPARRLSYAIHLVEGLAHRHENTFLVQERRAGIERELENVKRIFDEMRGLLQRARRRLESPTHRDRDVERRRMSGGKNDDEKWFEVFERDLERLRSGLVALWNDVGPEKT